VAFFFVSPPTVHFLKMSFKIYYPRPLTTLSCLTTSGNPSAPYKSEMQSLEVEYGG
jgi:hypothetical protein